MLTERGRSVCPCYTGSIENVQCILIMQALMLICPETACEKYAVPMESPVKKLTRSIEMLLPAEVLRHGASIMVHKALGPCCYASGKSCR